MRTLQLHCNSIEYEPTHKEIEIAENIEKKIIRFEDIVTVFVSIEKGDNENTAKQMVIETKESMKKLGSNNLLIYPYAHLSEELMSPEKALEMLKILEDMMKKEISEVKRAPFGWTKSLKVDVKGHPLAEQARRISTNETEKSKDEITSKAISAEEKLKSEWMILDLDGKLIPVDKFDFSKNKKLKMLADYERSKNRSANKEPAHVKLMKRLELIDYEPGSDSGNMRYYPKGKLVKTLLEQYVTQKIREYGGLEVETPVMYDFQHPSLASYLNRFPARQYVVKSENKDYFLRFSACFGQFLMAKDSQISHRNLPLKLYELTRYSFRREKSGELSGLRRLRAFTMPDCHALCKDMEQAKEEAIKRMNLSLDVLEGIGLEKEDYDMAIRFTKDFYDNNKEFIKELISNHKKPALVEMWNERFFYFVMKWEFNFTDETGKSSALSTDQIDVENAERYGITFVDEDGNKKSPIILHNSPSGAIERCIYALLERTEINKNNKEAPSIPSWLAPTQIRFIPIGQEYVKKITELIKTIDGHEIRIDIDDRNETMQKKIREAEREWIPYIVVYGKKEEESNELMVRDRVTSKMLKMDLNSLAKLIKEQRGNKPYMPLPSSQQVSKRPIF